MKFCRIYLTKSDVWSYAPHWMTSASRDIFFIFYKAIRATFKNQFDDPEIKGLTEKIFFLRSWHHNNMREIYNKTKESNPNFTLIPYTEGSQEGPKDYEYKYFDGTFEEDTSSELIEPNVIYKDFNDFFKNADHGFENSESTCKELYDYFIQDITPEKLKTQYLCEMSIYHKHQIHEVSSFKKYFKSGSKMSFKRWLIKKELDI